MPTAFPLEAQTRVCTKSATAKIKKKPTKTPEKKTQEKKRKNYCKMREGKHYSLQVLAELACSSHYRHCCASLQKPIYEALPSLSQLYLRS